MKRPVYYCHIVNQTQSLAFAGTSLNMMATSGCKEHSQCSHRLLCPRYCAAPVATTCVDWVTGGLRSQFQMIKKRSMRWRRQNSRIFVCFEERTDSVRAVRGAYSAPRNTLIHDALFHVSFLLFSTLLFLKSNKVLCSVSENLLTSDICQGLRSSRVLCCGKAQRPVRREILGIYDISQGFRFGLVWFGLDWFICSSIQSHM